MIIKTKAGDSEATAAPVPSWRFYDNVREVHAYHIDKSEMFRIIGMTDEEQAGISVECQGVVEENMLDPDIKGATCLRIAFTDHQGEARHLYVNRETYILNDNGKTIERLY